MVVCKLLSVHEFFCGNMEGVFSGVLCSMQQCCVCPVLVGGVKVKVINRAWL